MIKFVKVFLLVEVIELAILGVLWLAWRFYLKDRLPKAWVQNLTMMGFTK